jgi:GlpG protein
MRHLTTLSGKSTAESFVAYLLTQGISTHVEPDAVVTDQWDVWVRDEDKNQLARNAYDEFVQSPTDPKYADAVKQARSILVDQKQKEIERRKNIRTPGMSSNRNLFGRGTPPLTLTLIVICSILGLVQFINPESNNWLSNLANKQLRFVDLDLYLKTHDPAASLKKLELWRIFTPAFLHGNPLHLLLNMLGLASLGKLTERLEGTGRFATLLVLFALASHLLQGLLPAQWYGSPNFVGISGVIFGLLGYIGIKTTLRPDIGVALTPQIYIMTGLMLVLGFTGVGAGSGFRLANMAHLGGLLAGIAVGYVLSHPRFDVK